MTRYADKVGGGGAPGPAMMLCDPSFSISSSPGPVNIVSPGISMPVFRTAAAGIAQKGFMAARGTAQPRAFLKKCLGRGGVPAAAP